MTEWWKDQSHKCEGGNQNARHFSESMCSKAGMGENWQQWRQRWLWQKWQRQRQKHHLWHEILWGFAAGSCLWHAALSHLLQAIAMLCAVPVAAWVRKKAKPKKKKKGLFCDFSFFSIVGDWDWALSQISGLWQWSGERSALQATKYKERERVAAMKYGRVWNACLDYIVEITEICFLIRMTIFLWWVTALF